MSSKYANLYLSEITKSAEEPMDLSLGGIAKSFLLDPAVNMFRDSGSAISSARAGDWNAVGGHALSAGGNLLHTLGNASFIVPGVGTIAGGALRGAGFAVKGLGAAAKGVQTARAAGAVAGTAGRMGSAGAKIQGVAKNIGLAADRVGRTLVPGLGKYMFPGAGAALKGGLVKGVVKPSLAWMAATVPLGLGADVLRNSSYEGKYNNIMQDPAFIEWMGKRRVQRWNDSVLGDDKGTPRTVQDVRRRKVDSVRDFIDRGYYDTFLRHQKSIEEVQKNYQAQQRAGLR